MSHRDGLTAHQADKMLPVAASKFTKERYSGGWMCSKQKKLVKRFYNKKNRNWLDRELYRIVNSIG